MAGIGSWYRRLTHRASLKEVLDSGATPPLSRTSVRHITEQLREHASAEPHQYWKQYSHQAAHIAGRLWKALPAAEQREVMPIAHRVWSTLFAELRAVWAFQHFGDTQNDIGFTDTKGWLDHLELVLTDHDNQDP
ncbi:hypothetical protein [Saccharopolyspora griseoalba]|uniref:Uncharacterized protein n=1 Tax=Saccharopolyspora griseoalba TaxID=1431848 RepID=A0ABW2LTL5_9PSEU